MSTLELYQYIALGVIVLQGNILIVLSFYFYRKIKRLYTDLCIINSVDSNSSKQFINYRDTTQYTDCREADNMETNSNDNTVIDIHNNDYQSNDRLTPKIETYYKKLNNNNDFIQYNYSTDSSSPVSRLNDSLESVKSYTSIDFDNEIINVDDITNAYNNKSYMSSLQSSIGQKSAEKNSFSVAELKFPSDGNHSFTEFKFPSDYNHSSTEFKNYKSIDSPKTPPLKY
jgi:hypothetical protein